MDNFIDELINDAVIYGEVSMAARPDYPELLREFLLARRSALSRRMLLIVATTSVRKDPSGACRRAGRTLRPGGTGATR